MPVTPKADIYSNKPERRKALEGLLPKERPARPRSIVWITDDALPGCSAFRFPPRRTFVRAALFFEVKPLSLESLVAWRCWARQRGVQDLRIALVDEGITDEAAMGRKVKEVCGDWDAPLPERERVALERGEFVRMPAGEADKDDPAHLTLLFGSMGALLNRIDSISDRFFSCCRVDVKARDRFVSEVSERLSSEEAGANEGLPAPADPAVRSYLPRILLLGETGVGKTLFARYLAQPHRPVRIAVPEYLGKEDMFEYDLFGYARGAYTGGRDQGSIGLLLANAGGVVFLDEIGDASATVQAKLLAYLDDYMVRPRGWAGPPFFCPTLIVAATNRDLREDASFRPDLLRRFTDIETIPPLRDRADSLHLILDCLLQNEAINPACLVTEIGDKAVAALRKHRYDGNFRELEDIMRRACSTALADGREYLCLADLPLQWRSE